VFSEEEALLAQGRCRAKAQLQTKSLEKQQEAKTSKKNKDHHGCISER